MSFSLKPQSNGNTNSNNAPRVDWNAINKQVETDNHTAVTFTMLWHDMVMKRGYLDNTDDKYTVQHLYLDFMRNIFPKISQDGKVYYRSVFIESAIKYLEENI